MELSTCLAQRIIQQVHSFTPFLRENGFRVGTSETLLAMQALTELELEQMEQVMHVFRSIYASSSGEWSIFPSLFKRHFSVHQHKLAQPHALKEAEKGRAIGTTTDQSFHYQLQGAMLPGYNPHVGQQYPLQFFQGQELEQIMKWTKYAVSQLEHPKSRRFQKGKGKRINFRNTLRLAMKSGGEPFKLTYLQSRPARPRIVIIIDVSGSMQEYAHLFLTIAWAFMHASARVEVFVFSTTIKRITPLLATTFIRGIPLEKLVELKGGTRIGFSLARLNEQYASLLRKQTIVFIFSDGFDTGDMYVLRQAMDQLVYKVARVIWCNPLLGEEEYEPISMGMQTVLAYTNYFVDVHDADSWIRAVRHHLFL